MENDGFDCRLSIVDGRRSKVGRVLQTNCSIDEMEGKANKPHNNNNKNGNMPLVRAHLLQSSPPSSSWRLRLCNVTSLLLFLILLFVEEATTTSVSSTTRDDDDDVKDRQTKATLSNNKIKQDDVNYKPHIVMIIMDDLGSNDLGIHASGIQTPTCDELISNGLFLTNYYVLPSCSPTRAALLSGRYPLHTGVQEWIQLQSTSGLPLSDETLPQILLQRANYTTHAVGKWHVGHSMWEQTPTYRGFESFYGFYTGGEDYFTHSTGNGGGYDLRYDSKEYCGFNCSQIVNERGNYSTHVFTREAIRIIRDYHIQTNTRTAATPKKMTKEERKDEDTTTKPLFLYLAYQAVHAPNEVPQEYLNMYENYTNWTKQRKIYAGMLSAADEGIYNVTIALQQYGLWDDTLVIFTTDNGGPTDVCAVQGSSNYPRRGGKCSIWEGGTQGDAFLSGPALRKLNIPSQSRYDDFIHVVDWLPTLADLLHVTPNGNTLDGVSQLTGFRERTVSIAASAAEGIGRGDTHDDIMNMKNTTNNTNEFPPARRELYIGHVIMRDGSGIHSTTKWWGPAIRYGKWKLIQGKYGGGPDVSNPNPPGTVYPAPGGITNTTYQLYDVSTDKGEQVDLSMYYPRVVHMLVRKLQYYQRTFVTPQPNDDTSCPFTGLVNNSIVGPTWYEKEREKTMYRSFVSFFFFFSLFCCSLQYSLFFHISSSRCKKQNISPKNFFRFYCTICKDAMV